MVELIEIGCIENTDRVACHTLNTVLHREGNDQTLKLRTMANLCDRHGKEVEEYQDEQTIKVLQRTGFDWKTGKLQEGVQLPDGILQPAEVRSEVSRERVKSVIDDINKKREDREKIPEDATNPYDVELPDDAVVEVSLDGVLAKRQKEHRGKAEKNQEEVEQQNGRSGKRPAVETSVAHIQVNGSKYILTAHNMRSLCIRLLAFLLNSGLLVNRQLIIYSDGAAEIRTCVNEVFSFCRHHIVLDWFHLRKHCYELLSMTLKSGKTNKTMRQNVLKDILRILWVGNVGGAIQYLTELPSKCIKSDTKKQELINYLQRKEPIIACYAVRARLGLRISSNPVEKANDLTVAKRQKNQGMSWSYHGSWHFAALTALYLNHEAERWHKDGSLSFNMVPISRTENKDSDTDAA